MNREKRAKAYANTALRPYGNVKVVGLFVSDITEIAEQAYLQGAKDAEDNPAWRKCEDELPPMRQNVLIAKVDKKTQRISILVASRHPSDCRFPNEKWVWSGNISQKNVVAWLPLPKFNPKAEKE